MESKDLDPNGEVKVELVLEFAERELGEVGTVAHASTERRQDDRGS